MKKQSFFYRNSLSVTLFAIFFIFLIAQAYTGWKQYNQEMLDDNGPLVDFLEYFKTAHFYEATAENWESEFLQMGMYVILTVFLRQRGSSESKKIDEKEEVDRIPKPHKDAPWPVKKGGAWLTIYKNSLSVAFLILFLISFFIHARASLNEFNKEQVLKGKSTETFVEFFSNSRLWFESFQNWQSEFLAVFSIVVLSIFLRQFGSPESKPVDAPDHQTGD